MEIVEMNNHEIGRPDSLLEHAIFYAGLGWHVFPVHNPQEDMSCSCGKADCDRVGKHPRIKGWQDRATTDEHIIRELWQQWRYANIGILTGEKSGIVVLDSDFDKGGLKSLKILRSLFLDTLDDMPCATTGGGVHLYFAHSGIKMPNKQGFLPGLDIRGDGGFVVAPPSRHRNGRQYQWKKAPSRRTN